MSFVDCMIAHGWQKAAPEGKLDFAPYSSTWIKGAVKVELAHNDLWLFKGSVQFYITHKNVWCIAAIIVQEKERHKGLGSAALDDLIQIAKELKAEALELEPKPIKRYKAKQDLKEEELVAWYMRHGFKPKDKCEGRILRLELA